MHTHHTARAQKHPITIGALLAVSIMVGASISNAAVMRAGSIYTLEEDAGIQGDAYLVGETVTTYGSTTGDALIIGSGVLVSGDIGSDALVLGGNVNVTAPVGGDLRVAGGDVELSGSTTEDVIAVGGNVTLHENAYVGGDLIVFADRLTIAGTVQGHIEAHARSVSITGTLVGPSDFDVRESLTLSGDARILSTLSYHAPREAVVSDRVVVEGEMVFTPRSVEREDDDGIAWMAFLLRALIVFVGGVLLLKLFPTATRRASEYALTNNGSAVFTGFGMLILTPFVIVILGMTLLGVLPAFMLMFAYGLLLLCACALTPILAGVILARWLKKQEGLTWAWVSLGAFALSFITLLPVIGWLVRFLVFLLALGTIGTLIYRGLWKKHNASAPASDTPAESPSTPVEHTESHEHEDTQKTEQPEEANASR